MAIASFKNTYVCDWLPYFKSNALRRLFASPTPDDWTAGLTIKADDTTRYAEIAANTVSTWNATTVLLGGDLEFLVLLRLVPGQYATTAIAFGGGGDALLSTTAGTLSLRNAGSVVASVALPAGVWTSSSVYSSAWVRVRLTVSGGNMTGQAWVWSPTLSESTAATCTTGAGALPAVSAASGLGATSGTSVSACDWFQFGKADGFQTPRRVADPDYFDKWMKGVHTNGGARMVTAELFIPGQTAAPAKSTAVLRAATTAYNSGNAYPLDNQAFPDDLLNFPEFKRELPDSLYGRQKFTVSDLVIRNNGGVNDHWLRSPSTQSAVSLRYGDPTWPWFDLAPLFTGVVSDIVESGDNPSKLHVTIKDAMERFNVPVATSLIANGSTNAGAVQPLALGTVFNASPRLTSAATLVHSLGSGPIYAVSAVRDEGVPLVDVALPNITSYNAATDVLTFAAAHGLIVGGWVRLGSAAIPPLLPGQVYDVASAPSPTTITVSNTIGGAATNLVGAGGAVTAACAKVKWIGGDVDERDGAVLAVADGAGSGTCYYYSELVSFTYVAVATHFFVWDQFLWADDGSDLTGGAEIDFVGGASLRGFTSDAYGTPPNGATPKGVWVTRRVSLAPLVGLTTQRALAAVESNTVSAQRTVVDNLRIVDAAGTVIVDIWSAGDPLPSPSGYGNGYGSGFLAASNLACLGVRPATGTLRLNSNPAGKVTVDLRGQKFGTLTSDNAGNALRVLAGQGDPIISTVIGTGTTFAKNIGLWVDQPAVLADQVDLLAQSCMSTWSTNRIGTLVATPFDTGSGYSYTCTLTSDDLRGQPQMGAHRLPVDYYLGYRIGYKTNYTEQRDADLAGSVTTANRALYGAANSVYIRPTGGIGSLVPTQNLPEVKTALVSSADATAVLNGLYASIGAEWMGVVTLTANWTALDQFQCGKRIKYKTSRYGFDNTTGTDCIVRAVTLKTADGSAALTLWARVPMYIPVTT